MVAEHTQLFIAAAGRGVEHVRAGMGAQAALCIEHSHRTGVGLLQAFIGNPLEQLRVTVLQCGRGQGGQLGGNHLPALQ